MKIRDLLKMAKENIVVFPGSLEELNRTSEKSYELMPNELFVRGLILPDKNIYSTIKDLASAAAGDLKEEVESHFDIVIEKLSKVANSPQFIKRDLRVIAYEKGANGIVHLNYCGQAQFEIETKGEKFDFGFQQYFGSLVKEKSK